MENSFVTVLKNAAQKKPSKQTSSAKWNEAFDIIQELSRAIREFTGDALECTVDPGFSVDIGQEWRVVLTPKMRPTFQHILLRAYLPPAGFPAVLNLYDDDMTSCVSANALRRSLTTYLENPNVLETIKTLAKLE